MGVNARNCPATTTDIIDRTLFMPSAVVTIQL
jgi:hypothetical protein